MTDEELKAIFQGEEIREIKNSLKEEQNRNYHLTQLLEQMKTQLKVLANRYVLRLACTLAKRV